jgi:hypothetical protein
LLEAVEELDTFDATALAVISVKSGHFFGLKTDSAGASQARAAANKCQS